MFSMKRRHHPQFTAYLALVCLCFFWGTTYLGIRIALESFPPATLVCIRNLISGSLILALGKLMGARVPRGRELWITAGLGAVTLGIGNGALTLAELWVPSGLASVFISTSPFWFVGLDALLPGGEPLHAPIIRALLIGAAGAIFLAAPSAWSALSGDPHAAAGAGWGVLLLQLSAAGWSFGSLLQRRQQARAHPFMSGAVGQLATGVVYLIPAIFEPGRVHGNARGASAILYLAIFGGAVGFSCFSLAMSRLPVAVASIYTYVNPVVAVFLGWAVYREPLGLREWAAMAVIFTGVAMVRRASSRQASQVQAARLNSD